MKKQLGKMLAMGMMVSLAATGLSACSDKPSPEQTTAAVTEATIPAGTEAAGEGINGTFEGTSPGMQGPVTVSVTVENGKITAINYNFPNSMRLYKILCFSHVNK